MIFFLKKQKINLLLLLILTITFIIYYPGLSGDYVFDDSANILQNRKLQIQTLSYLELKAAALSGGAGPLGRPLSMISFAINYYFTDFNPYYFKLTNILIHLCNGILIYFLSFFILQRLNNNTKLFDFNKLKYLSLMVAMIWLIHPLNLTSVLYVVQRMTSLATLFGLSALVIYCWWRSSFQVHRNITVITWLSIILLLSASIFSKESGVLFIIIIYWVELIIFKAENKQQQPIWVGSKKLSFWLWTGVVLGCLIAIWLIQPVLNPINFVHREFNLTERLLTESRVIFYYLKLFFYPQLSDLSLYHDDFLISSSIFKPISTFYSIAALVLISLLSLILYKKYPLLIFAWGFYLISQLLESTVISLELVHEHRAYFGTIGFILLIVSILASITSKIKPFVILFMILYAVNLATTTLQRAIIWSNLVDQASFEASNHPYSDRANYQLARIYMKLMLIDIEKRDFYAKQAALYLQKAKQSYYPSNGGWFVTLHLKSAMGWKINRSELNELIDRLKSLPFSNNNIGYLTSFTDCQIKFYCKVPHDQAVLIIAAGLENPTLGRQTKAEIYKLLAKYFIEVISDFTKGEYFLRQGLLMHNDVNGHILLCQTYRLQGKLKQAHFQLKLAQDLDEHDIWYTEIAEEKKKLNQVR